MFGHVLRCVVLFQNFRFFRCYIVVLFLFMFLFCFRIVCIFVSTPDVFVVDHSDLLKFQLFVPVFSDGLFPDRFVHYLGFGSGPI